MIKMEDEYKNFHNLFKIFFNCKTLRKLFCNLKKLMQLRQMYFNLIK